VKRNVRNELIALRATVTEAKDAKKLDEAIKEITDSLAAELWVNQTHIVPKHGDRVFHEEKETAKKLEELLKDKKSLIPDAVLLDFIARIVKSDRLLAEVAIVDAMAAGLPAKKIAEAQKEMAKGDEYRAEGKYDQAIEHYEHAWKEVSRLRVTMVARPAGGQSRLEMIGYPGTTYTIEASTNLSEWIPIGKRTADAEGNIVFDDPGTAQSPKRFYRIRTP
jgi:hypothetical protein